MVTYHHTPARAGRIYTVWLQQDLFGEWTLVRVRSRRQREPILKSTVVESREAGEALMAALVKVRLRHGYKEVGKEASGGGDSV